MKSLLEIINVVLENKNKDILDKISRSAKLRDDIGFDSLDLAELTVRIESEYGVDIFKDGIISTIGEIMDKLDGGNEK